MPNGVSARTWCIATPPAVRNRSEWFRRFLSVGASTSLSGQLQRHLPSHDENHPSAFRRQVQDGQAVSRRILQECHRHRKPHGVASVWFINSSPIFCFLLFETEAALRWGGVGRPRLWSRGHAQHVLCPNGTPELATSPRTLRRFPLL